tara:strand:- start:9629 stop:12043 length:2415 start_codon:yes stop_codon:yes gene_type:complete
MPNVSQRVQSYLGGVSRQPDDKKLPGQLVDCVNAYPDPTFGLTKRPGFKFLKDLGNENIYANAKWFYIHRDGDEKYIGCIKGTAVYIWNATSGVAATITYSGSSNTDYLTGTKATDYDVLTVQDTTIITNKSITVTTQAAPSFTANKVGTVKIKAVTPQTTYSVSIKIGSTTQIATYTTPDSADIDTILTDLKSDIDGWTGDFDNLTVTRLDTSLEISSTVAFTLSGKGGADNDRLVTYQNQVANVTTLPDRSLHNRVVKVFNTANSAQDTYYSRFIADDGVSGSGYWEEYIAPDVSPGLTASTMPHELVNTAANTFTFKPISWTQRLVGDDTTNSHPTFVGQKIQQAFFHSSRLGFLTKDNVSMSQANEFYNFYHVSALTQIASDPVDLNTSSIRPTVLTGVIPTAQGLVLFSRNQQFMMYAPNGILTPTSTIIRGISNYEMDIDIDPVDNGTNIIFISKTPSYSRIFQMRTAGQEMNPTVLDIGRIVSEWIPSSVTELIASPQNSFVAMHGPTKKDVYFYRTFSDGQREIMQSWFRWELPGNVQSIAIDSDSFYAVTMQGGQYTLLSASINQTPEEQILVNSDGQKMNPCVDLYAAASSVAYEQTDPVNPYSKCYIPFNNVTGLEPVVVIASSASDIDNPTFVESGFTTTPTVATDGTGTYFKVPNKDFSSIASRVIVGFKYTLDITLPKTYYRLDEEGTRSDFSASLTVARMKFSTGLSGLVGFKLKRFGTADYIDVHPVILANFNLANDVPLDDQSVVMVPIHQKTDNFTLKVSSDTPFPVSITSMMWEGYYSPRFYRRN